MALTPEKVDELVAKAKTLVSPGRLTEAEAYIDSKLMKYAQSGISTDAISIDLWSRFNDGEGNALNPATISALINLYTNAGWGVSVDDHVLLLSKRLPVDAKVKVRRSPQSLDYAPARPW